MDAFGYRCIPAAVLLQVVRGELEVVLEWSVTKEGQLQQQVPEGARCYILGSLECGV